MSKFDAYEAGMKACNDGLHYSDCPEDLGEDEKRSWKMGWAKAREEKTK